MAVRLSMHIYNTLTKNKENFVPIKENEIGFYQCGPTVYWTQHIGNLRAMLTADLIRRSLSFLGYKVTYVRNYTDVGHLTGDNIGDADSGEDRMEKASKRESLSPMEVAQKYTDQFEKDTSDLNILAPDFSPKATDHIKEMQEMVSELLEKGFAYATPLAIYFDVSKAKDYTKLSGQDLSKNITDAGHGNVADGEKRNPSDFALWFFKAGTHENALQTWPSPFESELVSNGEGFPGWHIECSAMAKKYLGKTFDIHMGGVEHISIHHTNEIAQSESANDATFAKYWIHNEHLLVDGKKMSKSEGTSYALSDIVEKGFSPIDLRYFMLQAHYRSKQNFTWDALQSAKNGLENLYQDIQKLSSDSVATNVADDSGRSTKVDFSENPLYISFQESISDDFNLPQALSIAYSVLKSDLSNEMKKSLLFKFDEVFGLDLEKNSISKSLDVNSLPENIQNILKERETARENKDWDLADKLREQLKESGYTVYDDTNGQRLELN